MRSYRDRSRVVETACARARLLRCARESDALTCLVEVGEWEQAVADARAAARDGWAEEERLLRRTTLAAARAYLRGRGDARADLDEFAAALEALGARPLPARVEVRAPEGYAHYALDPAAYAASARAYRADAGERASRAVVLGVRSIGTGLSAVVAAVVGSERTFTVRPRGETGSRRIAADGALTRTLRAWLRDAPDVLVVDEGPGATGETFECTARWLEGLGVGADRIVLFPSHTGGMALAPAERRDWFERARKHTPPVRDDRLARVAEHFGLDGVEDLSAGRWRERVEGGAEAPAWTGFERLKARARGPEGVRWQIRFAGLGGTGADAVARARELAEAGLMEEVLGARDGFLVRRWVEGRLPRRRELERPEFASALGEHLVGRAGRFGTRERVRVERSAEVLEENAGEALGAAAAAGRGVERLLALPEREAYVPDARMARPEWIRTDDGFRKVDGCDHGDGLRLPGPTDAAWDLAAAAVEFPAAANHLARWCRACARATGSSVSELHAAVEAYRPVYAASALGDAAIGAREAITEEDRSRLRALAARYRRKLAAELRVTLPAPAREHAPPPPPPAADPAA